MGVSSGRKWNSDIQWMEEGPMQSPFQGFRREACSWETEVNLMFLEGNVQKGSLMVGNVRILVPPRTFVLITLKIICLSLLSTEIIYNTFHGSLPTTCLPASSVTTSLASLLSASTSSAFTDSSKELDCGIFIFLCLAYFI